MLLTFADGDEVLAVVCGKRCYNVFIKTVRETPADNSIKKRVMWHNDGRTPSISSLSCLIDWLTTGDNYSRYRGGAGQTGETKMVIANEVVRAIEESGILAARTAKDVMTKIAAIEASFKKAVGWLANTGQGLTDEASLKAAILSRCQYYYELYDVMFDRPTMTPLMLNTDAAVEASDDGGDRDENGDDGASDNSENQADASSSGNTRSQKRPSSTPLSVVSLAKKIHHDAGVFVDPSLLELKESHMQQELEVKRKKLSFRQQQVEMQREEKNLRMKKAINDERESEVRIANSVAKAEKLRHQGDHWKLQVNATLLHERKRLLEEGVLHEDIDKMLPLPV